MGGKRHARSCQCIQVHLSVPEMLRSAPAEVLQNHTAVSDSIRGLLAKASKVRCTPPQARPHGILRSTNRKHSLENCSSVTIWQLR